MAPFEHSVSGDVLPDTELFEAFGGVTGEGTGRTVFIAEEGSVWRLGCQNPSPVVWSL